MCNADIAKRRILHSKCVYKLKSLKYFQVSNELPKDITYVKLVHSILSYK